MDSDEPPRLRFARRLGRKPQVGGALAAFIGLLLWLATPATNPSDPVNLHHLAAIFLVVGIGLFLMGTFARWYWLK